MTSVFVITSQLNANIRQLSEDLRADRSQQTDIVASEIRGLSSSIAALSVANSFR